MTYNALFISNNLTSFNDYLFSLVNGLFVGLLSCGVIVVMVTSSVGVLLR